MAEPGETDGYEAAPDPHYRHRFPAEIIASSIQLKTLRPLRSRLRLAKWLDSLRPLEVQPSLRGANECLSLSVTHEPVPPLPMPTRSGTYLTPETHQYRVPGEFEWLAFPAAQPAINSRLFVDQQIRRRTRSADGR